MGAGASHSAEDRGGSAYATGLHVLRVTPGSPASATDIQPFFDFVVGIDGDAQSDVSFVTEAIY
jgi:hypothetical protein